MTTTETEHRWEMQCWLLFDALLTLSSSFPILFRAGSPIMATLVPEIRSLVADRKPATRDQVHDLLWLVVRPKENDGPLVQRVRGLLGSKIPPRRVIGQ